MRQRATRASGRAAGRGAAHWRGALGFALLAGLSACGQSPINAVAPLTPVTRIYAFEPGLIYAYQVDADGQIEGIGGARFRVAERQLNGVIADRGGRFLYGFSESAGEVWVYALDATGMPSLVPGSPFTPRSPHALHALAVAPLTRHLYVAGERPGVVRGDVTAFRIDPVTGALSELDESPFRTGVGPFRIWLDPDGRFVYVANNGSQDPWRKQSLSVYRVDPESGVLDEVPDSAYETITFVGFLQFHPSRRLLYATAGPFFLGYSIAPDGALTDLHIPNNLSDVPEGSEVLALRVTADGNYLYAIENSGWAVAARIDTESGMLSFVGETRAAQGFSAAAFHRRQPLAVVLGRDEVALNVRRLDPTRGLLLPASATIDLPDGLKAHEGGAKLFFDASDRVLCVVVDDTRDSARARVRLLTYRLRDDASLQPIGDSTIGEGPHPVITVVPQGTTP